HRGLNVVPLTGCASRKNRIGRVEELRSEVVRQLVAHKRTVLGTEHVVNLGRDLILALIVSSRVVDEAAGSVLGGREELRDLQRDRIHKGWTNFVAQERRPKRNRFGLALGRGDCRKV